LSRDRECSFAAIACVPLLSRSPKVRTQQQLLCVLYASEPMHRRITSWSKVAGMCAVCALAQCIRQFKICSRIERAP